MNAFTPTPITGNPICAVRVQLSGCYRAEAFGIVARCAAPVCALARTLIRAGFDPKLPLEAYRGEVLALRCRLIEAARLTVDDTHGPPRFRIYRPLSSAVLAQNEKNRRGAAPVHAQSIWRAAS